MARSSMQKKKILLIMRELLEKTDENHPLTIMELIFMLSENGISAERKSIYHDIEVLREFGIDIENRREKPAGYYVASRDFELPELKLLVDAVQCTRFITKKKSKELIRKLENLTSRSEAVQLRPAVANVDQALIVTSCKDPDFSIHLLDRLIILVSLSDVEPVICLTKWDLIGENDRVKIKEQIDALQACGYKAVWTYPGSDDSALREVLDHKVSVLCGQSGAGKSSLLNRLEPGFALQTQQISRALGRGKHTTRFCELHEVAGGLVADTPGFSSLDFSLLDTKGLDRKLKAFAPYIGKCRFADCRHINEPDCAIKEAVARGHVPASFYEDYKAAALAGKESYK